MVKVGKEDLKNEHNNTIWTKNKKAADFAAGKKASDSGGSTPIIIGCVAGAFVLIGGVCFWKYKQNAKKSETAEPAELPIEFAADDCYKAFVDQEL